MLKITEFLHASLLVSDLGQACAFYEGVLGLVPSAARPAMSFDGVWYEIGAQQIHLLVLPDPCRDVGHPQHGGRDRHIALAVADIDDAREALEQANVGYTLSRSGRAALFCRDPDGNALELVQSG
jgi:glyoxylase I family protein